MEKMQLEEIRRNYFDPKAAVTLAAHKLEIWPGYVTSIRQHEDQILLCCEVSCKVLRLVFNCRIVVDIKMFLTVPALLGLTLPMTKSRRFARGWGGTQLPSECGEGSSWSHRHHKIQQPDL